MLRLKTLFVGLVSVAGIFVTQDAHADLSISFESTQNVSCDAGICTATDRKAVLNVSDLVNLLGGSEVWVKTGTATKDITVRAGFSWPGGSRLKLEARRSILIRKAVIVASQSSLSIATGKNGQLSFERSGRIAFLDKHSSLTINGHEYILVRSVKDLLKQSTLHPSALFALANSYDAAQDGTYHRSPIPQEFDTTFDGLGNAIQRLSVDVTEGQSGENNHGLFAYSTGVLQNIKLSRVKFTAKHTPHPEIMGALVGRNDGMVRGVSVTGNIRGSDSGQYDAGIVGANYGTVMDSHVNASIVGGSWVGGVVGSNASLISNSSFTGTVSGSCNCGGLAAYSEGLITGSYAMGSVDNSRLGEFYTGEVGGLVGENSGTVMNSYAGGSAIGFNNSTVGGLLGYNGGMVTATYSTTAVSPQACDCGGFVGQDEAEAGFLANDYWNLETSNIDDPSKGAANKPNDPGITGLTDAELKSGLPAGFDPKIWGQSPNINNGYPYLLANPPQ